MQIELLEIWRSIFEHVEIGGEEGKERGRDMERIRTIMEYIQKHYTDKITLKDLADQIHLCRSECCRMFKRCMNETMFEYLLNYRIEKSLELLRRDSDLRYGRVWKSGLLFQNLPQKDGVYAYGISKELFFKKMSHCPAAATAHSLRLALCEL